MRMLDSCAAFIITIGVNRSEQAKSPPVPPSLYRNSPSSFGTAFQKLQKHCLSFPSFNDLQSLVFFFLRQNVDRMYESKEQDHMLFFNITDELKCLWLFGSICEVLRLCIEFNLLFTCYLFSSCHVAHKASKTDLMYFSHG